MKTPVNTAKFVLDEIFALRSYLRSVTKPESGEFTRHADLDVIEEHLCKIEKSLNKLRFRNCDRFKNITEATDAWRQECREWE